MFLKGSLPCRGRIGKTGLCRLTYSLQSSWPYENTSVPRPSAWRWQAFPQWWLRGVCAAPLPLMWLLGKSQALPRGHSQLFHQQLGDQPGAKWLNQGLSKAGLFPTSLFSCLSPLSVKSLELLLLQEQPLRVFPRTPDNAGLETMPGDALGDTGHMLVRNPCTVMTKSRSSGGREPQHWLSYIAKGAAGGGYPTPSSWHPTSLQISMALVNTRGSCRSQGWESRTLRGRESVWKYGFNNFEPVSVYIFQWQYTDIKDGHCSFNQLHGVMGFWGNFTHDTYSVIIDEA